MKCYHDFSGLQPLLLLSFAAMCDVVYTAIFLTNYAMQPFAPDRLFQKFAQNSPNNQRKHG